MKKYSQIVHFEHTHGVPCGEDRAHPEIIIYIYRRKKGKQNLLTCDWDIHVSNVENPPSTASELGLVEFNLNDKIIKLIESKKNGTYAMTLGERPSFAA